MCFYSRAILPCGWYQLVTRFCAIFYSKFLSVLFNTRFSNYDLVKRYISETDWFFFWLIFTYNLSSKCGFVSVLDDKHQRRRTFGIQQVCFSFIQVPGNRPKCVALAKLILKQWQQSKDYKNKAKTSEILTRKSAKVRCPGKADPETMTTLKIGDQFTPKITKK